MKRIMHVASRFNTYFSQLEFSQNGEAMLVVREEKFRLTCVGQWRR